MCIAATLNGSETTCECSSTSCVVNPTEKNSNSRRSFKSWNPDVWLDGDVCQEPIALFSMYLIPLFSYRGFGSQMAKTPMVIMWLNNGQVILSQREASSEVMPTVVANPPRTATLAPSLSIVSGLLLVPIPEQ